jgi:uncharacterized protein
MHHNSDVYGRTGVNQKAREYLGVHHTNSGIPTGATNIASVTLQCLQNNFLIVNFLRLDDNMWSQLVSWICFAAVSFLALLIFFYILIVLVTVILAIITCWRRKFRDSKSRLFTGRVSHSRMVPKLHSFSYPIFMVLVDLEDNMADEMYPLSLIMSLSDDDHYKNREGLNSGDEEKTSTTTLLHRTLRLVAEKTEQKFQPTSESHSVLLLTHLRYYGYCFNPVSFYYIVRRDNFQIDAVVAEVSNTPWNEMQCYVLHPESIDIQQVKSGRSYQGSSPGINYLFLKTFHVSPFMDMDFLYDWIFWDIPPPQTTSSSLLRINTSMYKAANLQFQAILQMSDSRWHPYTIAWHLVRFPVFCFILQIWIHIQAFWLFSKGVEYIPHPNGTETAASLVIGNLMAPAFALKAWWDSKVMKPKSQ